MSTSNDDGKAGLFGQRLPGTGGDAVPTDDDQDVEGHKQRRFADDDQDVEGNLFRTGPTTTGEFSRRGPGENPHGDR